MTRDPITGEIDITKPVVLPIPMPVAAHRDDKIVIFTKFLSWLTATLLAVAVIISLVAVTSERNDLRAQLSAQSTELTCRSAAAIVVNKAVAERDNKLTEALVNVRNEDPTVIAAIVEDLKGLTIAVNEAIEAQQVALKECDKS